MSYFQEKIAEILRERKVDAPNDAADEIVDFLVGEGLLPDEEEELSNYEHEHDERGWQPR